MSTSRHIILETSDFTLLVIEDVSVAHLEQIGPGGEVLADIPIPNLSLMEMAKNMSNAAIEIHGHLNH